MEPWIEELVQASAAADKMTEKQARIVEAAIEMFAEKGYSGASTSEIAQRAGVAEGTIFRHYKTKKDLLLSIVTPAMLKLITPFVLREFKDVLNQEYESYDLFLRAMIENRIAFVQKNKSLIRIIAQEIPFHPELREQFETIVLSQVVVRMEKRIEKFKEQGQIRADLPTVSVLRMTASTLIGYVLMRDFAATRPGSAWDDGAEREATISFIVKGLAP